jgi:hypothetical protein
VACGWVRAVLCVAVLVGAGVAGAADGSAGAGGQVAVSSDGGRHSEVSVALDPVDPRVLVAGSNTRFAPGSRMPAYGSADGGQSWSSTGGPPLPPGERGSCADGNSAVAIGPDHRQYYAFLVLQPCRPSVGFRIVLAVAHREGPHGRWVTPARSVPRPSDVTADDRPALTVDLGAASPHRGRLHLAWTRIYRGPFFHTIQLSHSDDGGRTWTTPVQLSQQGAFASGAVGDASIAVARDGEVYVAWDDAIADTILLAHSLDGIHFGRARLVARWQDGGPFFCTGLGFGLPAQPARCIRANPLVTVDGSPGRFDGRVYLTYSTAASADGDENVFLIAFTPDLIPLWRTPLAIDLAAGTGGDHFFPASALDAATGWLWVCFYDTAGDPQRIEARYVCTASQDGGRHFAPAVTAATVPSNERQLGADPHGYGDYEALAVAGGIAHPLWTDSRDLPTRGEQIYTTTLTNADIQPPGGQARAPTTPVARLERLRYHSASPFYASEEPNGRVRLPPAGPRL